MIRLLDLARRALLIITFAAPISAVQADTPASLVTRTVVGPGQAYPEVATNSEAWFDVGGFCKVVDVGSLTWTNPQASAVPVFIPGTAGQWENYRTVAPSAYHGDLVLTTCCRSQANIATLCANTANPVSVSRQYGFLGETDTVAATCTDSYGTSYTESVAVGCAGDNGPDGQGAWVQASGISDQCAPNAWTSACSAVCPTTTGTTTTRDSCGNVTGTAACSITCACDPSVIVAAGPCRSTCQHGVRDQCGNTRVESCTGDLCGACIPDGSCSGACGGGAGVDNCGNACTNTTACPPPPPTAAPCPATVEVWGGYCAASFSAASGASDTESSLISNQPGYVGCNGSATFSCNNGTLSFVSGSCTQSCSNATTANTCPSVANGTTAAYPGCAITCNSGYTLSGGSCVATTCPTPAQPANGSASPGTEPACAPVITCNPGYTLSGNVCVANAPVCQPSLVTTCGACSQTTGKKSCITTDINNCPGSTSTPSTQNCALLPVGQWTCTFSVPDYLPDSGPPWSTSPPATGGYTEYLDCGYQGDPNGYSWVCAPGGLCSDTPGVTCYDDPCVQKEPYVHYDANGNITTLANSYTCGVKSQTCLGYK